MANFKMNKTDTEVEEYLKVLLPAVDGKETQVVIGEKVTSADLDFEILKDNESLNLTINIEPKSSLIYNRFIDE